MLALCRHRDRTISSAPHRRVQRVVSEGSFPSLFLSFRKFYIDVKIIRNPLLDPETSSG